MNLEYYSGKNVLVTGGCGGLGSQLVRNLSKAGANLVITGRSREKLAKLIEGLHAPDKAVAITADLSFPDQVAELAQQGLRAWGHIDVLFNNAGVGYFALMEEARPEHIRKLFEVNTFAPLQLINFFLPVMRKRGSGKIVNILSCAGRVPIPTVGVYGGSKSALAIMTNAMRTELMGSCIEMINIYVGTTDTAFERHALREADRSRVRPTAHGGQPDAETAEKVLEAATGSSGEAWLEKRGKILSAASILRPGYVEKKTAPLKDRINELKEKNKTLQYRKWRLWQVESSLECNLKCVMCPWPGVRKDSCTGGLMAQKVWDALVPYLPDVKTIDFTGGGEPLLQQNLLNWIAEAKNAGCEAGFLSNGLLLREEIAEELIKLEVDWLAFSIDGATKESYEKIRTDSHFETVTGNIAFLSRIRTRKRPLVMINFVIMNINGHEMEEIVKLAHKLGVDQVNFKQCDVIRENYGRGFGLFGPEETREIRRLQKNLRRATKLAAKLGIKTTAFSFTPEELPVCGQDPRTTLFVSHNGLVSPCINLSYGGKTIYLGREVEMPPTHYGRLPEDDLSDIWRSETCRFIRNRFCQRVKTSEQAFTAGNFGRSMHELQRAMADSKKAMPAPPRGCDVCHYLLDI